MPSNWYGNFWLDHGVWIACYATFYFSAEFTFVKERNKLKTLENSVLFDGIGDGYKEPGYVVACLRIVHKFC